MDLSHCGQLTYHIAEGTNSIGEWTYHAADNEWTHHTVDNKWTYHIVDNSLITVRTMQLFHAVFQDEASLV